MQARGHNARVTDVIEPTTQSNGQRTRRIPVWALLVLMCLLFPVLAVGGYWINYKKPWLIDDFRTGYAVGVDADNLNLGEKADPCALAMATKYGGEPSYDQYITPEDQSAFYIGCYRGFHGVVNDWWNVSGYLTE